uniref:Uncharacterized protein n=1 Tax=Thiocapsa roseopersicina TaxID=1058 RepID=Q9R6S2_THIRO|nr:unknown [Thiocapsa roseopersicina]
MLAFGGAGPLLRPWPLAGTRFKLFISFNILNRADSNARQGCRGRSDPKTSHTSWARFSPEGRISAVHLDRRARNLLPGVDAGCRGAPALTLTRCGNRRAYPTRTTITERPCALGSFPVQIQVEPSSTATESPPGTMPKPETPA